MGLTRTVKCDVEGCVVEHSATCDAEGYPGWGMVQGDFINNKTGDANAMVCPEHFKVIKSLLNGGK